MFKFYASISPVPHSGKMIGAYDPLVQSFLGTEEAKISKNQEDSVESFGMLLTVQG